MDTRKMLLGKTYLPIAGVKSYPHAVSKLALGQQLTITHEPDNPYDANALRVDNADGETLGYVPAALAKRIIGDLGGVAMSAEVAEITQFEGQPAGARIRVTVIHDLTAV